MVGMLVGCTSKAPSDQDVEVAIKNLWASYSWEFSSNFDVESFERQNGWKEEQDYWVEAAYKVKARQSYYEMVADCVEPTAENYSDTPMGTLSLGLSAMLKELQGTEALDEYAEYIKTHPEPEKMVQVSKKYKAEYVNISFLDCINHLAEKSTVFNRSLKAGDFTNYSVKLRFKKTEQGWKNL
jgi:hypothetical protein